MSSRLPLPLTRLRSEQTIICTSLAAAMQRITDAINGGYKLAVQGSVPLQKGSAVVEKFRHRHPGLTRDRKYAYRQRKAGKARHKLVCFANRSASELLFVLFTDVPDAWEKWAQVTDRRARIQIYEYEAVRTTKPGSGQVWTWQISSDAFAKGVAIMRAAVRRKELEVLQHQIDRTRTWPGFHGVRAQREELRRIVTEEWKRSMPDGDLPPAWPNLRYKRRLRTR